MKQQQLIFDKGITNTPSDTICSDNALQECLNLYYREGEHRPIQSAELYMSGAPHLLFVHRYAGEMRFITLDGSSVKWGTRDTTDPDSPVYAPALDDQDEEIVLFTASGDVSVQAIGKTLICSDNNGLHYFLWKDGEYENMDSQIPEPTIRFAMGLMKEENHISDLEYFNQNIHRVSKDNELFVADGDAWAVKSGKKDDYNNVMIGLYAEIKEAYAKQNMFCQPFFIRYALEMFDGSYYMISNPIMMLPCIHESTGLVIHTASFCTMSVYSASKIYYKANFDYSQWRDIIKDVVVFVSSGVDLYDTITEQELRSEDGTSTAVRIFDFVGKGAWASNDVLYHDLDPVAGGMVYKPLTKKAETDFVQELMDTSVFYKICSLGLTANTDGSFVDMTPFIKPHTIENLTTQEQLDADDFFSRSPLIPTMMYAYNSRLNIAGVSRGFFTGFESFLYKDYGASPTPIHYYIYVYIHASNQDVTICHGFMSTEYLGNYFYYPDSRAYHAKIYAGSQLVSEFDLKEHMSLHGAYYFSGLPTGNPIVTYDQLQPSDTYDNNASEYLSNQVMQSQVNNPFFFPASGYFSVGNGNVMAITSQTYALSEGQYGQFPILVFTDEGIWAANTGSDGAIVSTTPMSREVCNSPHTITQTDGPVFFLSDKGLMMIAGKSVECMSRQLSGREDDISNRLDIANIAFDYRDSLLWLFTESGGNRCFIYNIPTGTFSRNTIGARLSPKRIYNVVNMYPDTLLQYTSGEVYSLLTRVNINDDENTYTATIKTRPMKLENGLALKSILQMRHICQFADEGSLSLRIFASNNLRSWVELKSLHGTPWKYYRFEYTFNGLKATDTFAGTLLITDERRSLRLR